ncbi:putative bifunctional UDP-N-acetylglucosamine transferase and deubiquitinase ALG13 isoform X1 [Metopolophium dirhodum]|uniref:putative bifunctional UDP-N-acetylglucosamine transferase and deubiquitinase ALG13 isoform X1 n=1 Tax=Metopolophium dirhodum TaxID=44670 RepID=UPI00298F4BE0|nr:putative bifunctional UDP-N-acetylglucosamine transferase and deubiquitinase ALG13 isoform X1 [Metopolophium dirhodum]
MLTLSVRNRSKSKRIQTPKIDELLESVGLLRHVVPRDCNSLFRCISQCVFLTQSCHMIVRQQLLQFSSLQTKEFSQMTQLPVENYANKITDTKIDGDLVDMHVAAKVYKINIAFYEDSHPFIPLNIETPNAVKTLNICLNYEGTYDLVLVKESVVNISFSQSIIYEMLYNNVFKLSGVDFAVKEMLFDRNLPASRSSDPVSLEKRATCTDMKELLEYGITPFPFKVAKALTPKLYRNTEYDIWLNNKKEKFYGRWNNWEFKEGSKCMVFIGTQGYHCYIQRIHGKNEPVEVYVKDLAKKIYVEYDQLKLIPVEQDMRELMESPTQINQVSSNIVDCNQFISGGPGQGEAPVQYPGFINGPIHGIFPGQIFHPSFYVHPYQQHPDMPMTPLNWINNENVVHPWYISTPPVLSNNFHPFNEQIILLEPPSNFNQNCMEPNCMETLSNSTGLHVQPIPPLLYCEHQSCVQCNNGEESVAMDSNRAYQPWLVPEFDVPADELHL